MAKGKQSWDGIPMNPIGVQRNTITPEGRCGRAAGNMFRLLQKLYTKLRTKSSIGDPEQKEIAELLDGIDHGDRLDERLDIFSPGSIVES